MNADSLLVLPIAPLTIGVVLPIVIVVIVVVVLPLVVVLLLRLLLRVVVRRGLVTWILSVCLLVVHHWSFDRFISFVFAEVFADLQNCNEHQEGSDQCVNKIITLLRFIAVKR